MTLAMPFFGKLCKVHVQTVPENMHIKCEVRTFNNIGALSI